MCDGGCRQPPLVLVGEVALAAPPAPHNFVLRDCTAEIPLALPPHQMAAGALLLGNVVALASFELLALPQLLPPAVGPPKRPLHETFLLWLTLGDSMTLGCGTDATKTDRAATCATATPTSATTASAAAAAAAATAATAAAAAAKG